jgi:hypothetical protein
MGFGVPPNFVMRTLPSARPTANVSAPATALSVVIARMSIPFGSMSRAVLQPLFEGVFTWSGNGVDELGRNGTLGE